MAEIPTDFDSELMRRQAELLNEEADRAVIMTMILAGVTGLVIGGLAFDFFAGRNELIAVLVAVGIPALAAVFGGVLGESRGLKARAQAQQLLVLIAIESHTRRAAARGTHTSESATH
jgi:hypothetical protein